MVAGTSSKPKNIPDHAVREKNFPSLDLRKHLVAFHALTGCDTTPFFYGISKKSALKVYRDNYELSEGLGEGDLTDQTIKDCEKFVCKLYNHDTLISTDTVRSALFGKSKSPENMPPNKRCLTFAYKESTLPGTDMETGKYM